MKEWASSLFTKRSKDSCRDPLPPSTSLARLTPAFQIGDCLRPLRSMRVGWRRKPARVGAMGHAAMIPPRSILQSSPTRSCRRRKRNKTAARCGIIPLCSIGSDWNFSGAPLDRRADRSIRGHRPFSARKGIPPQTLPLDSAPAEDPPRGKPSDQEHAGGPGRTTEIFSSHPPDGNTAT